MYGIEIYKFVEKMKKKYRTSDPFKVAKLCGITVQYREDFDELKGMFTLVSRCPFIFLNPELDEYMEKVVMFHELGHYFLHRQKAAAFNEFSLYDMTSKFEIEANIFASNYLISDEDVEEYAQRGFTSEQTAYSLGVPHELLLIKLNDMRARGFDLNVAFIPKSNFLA